MITPGGVTLGGVVRIGWKVKKSLKLREGTIRLIRRLF